ncbi:MAG: ribonuclease H family protein [Oscillospiraceae bacterium]|nr:ribonuclease H family protein [Oscillospiraceae bacterium]
MGKKFYAVRCGRSTGIFTSWDECKRYVTGYPGAAFKGFERIEDAEAFMNVDTSNNNENIGDRATAYVDGSYNAKNKHFSYGAVIMYKGEEYRLSGEFDDKSLAEMRNVAGEIKGSEAAMRFCAERGIPAVDIYHDYEGIAKWCRGEWKTNKDGTKAYVELYKKMSEKLDINFIKVKGHSGDKYNDIADFLAKSALGIIG